MSLIDQVKAAQIAARKSRNSAAAATLTTLIGEAEAVGKNAGRAPTDEEVVATVKKFIKNIDATLAVLIPVSVAYEAYAAEKALLETFQPKQMSEEELTAVIKTIAAEVGATSPKDMGKVMAALKAAHDGQYDGKLASQLVKAALA